MSMYEFWFHHKIHFMLPPSICSTDINANISSSCKESLATMTWFVQLSTEKKNSVYFAVVGVQKA